jgi:hypothetical protein
VAAILGVSLATSAPALAGPPPPPCARHPQTCGVEFASEAMAGYVEEHWGLAGGRVSCRPLAGNRARRHNSYHCEWRSEGETWWAFKGGRAHLHCTVKGVVTEAPLSGGNPWRFAHIEASSGCPKRS